METIFDDMRTLYATRRLSQVNAFMEKWLAQDCIVMGTALGEIQRTRAEVRELFLSDLRYWYDLDIDAASAQREEIGEYEHLSCPAVSSYIIHENENRYKGYIGWCDEIIAEASLSPAQKGAQIAFILDTLLSARKHKRRENRMAVTIHAIMHRRKAVFLCFAFDKSVDTADHYLNDGETTATRYDEERSLLSGPGIPGVEQSVRAMGYEDVCCASADGRIFYGVGILPRGETLDEAMRAVLVDYKQEDAYRTLFDLRLRIAYLQKTYALGEDPRAVVRFFGIAGEGAVQLFVPVYPHNYYIEWR